MGYYIEVPEPKDKDWQLRKLYGAVPTEPTLPSALDPDQALVCVVQNGPFDAVGLVYSDDEYIAFTQPDDLRPKSWLLMDRTQAYELAGYKPR